MGHLPSVNRVMGLKWLAGLFHPEAWQGDLRAETVRFYSLRYHVELTDAEIEVLLERARPRPN